MSIGRGELTRSLQNKPVLDPELTLVWDAFMMTTGDRMHTMRFSGTKQWAAAERIPLQAIMAFCDLAGMVDSNQRFRVVRLVQAMDRAFLDKINPQVK